MASVDDAFSAAQNLDTEEKLQLISRIWESIPAKGDFRPSDSDLAEVKRRWADYEAGRETPWEEVWSEVEGELGDDRG
jgi:putative addiction module component (TIGR02574 family)